MINKVINYIKMLKNIEKIKDAVSIFYEAITKILNILNSIESQINDVKKLESFKKYLKESISILEKLKIIIEKYGIFIGFSPPTIIQTIILANDLDKDLKIISDKLDGLF